MIEAILKLEKTTRRFAKNEREFNLLPVSRAKINAKINGIQPSTYIGFNVDDANGWTPLHFASWFEHNVVVNVKFLFENHEYSIYKHHVLCSFSNFA